MPYLTPDEIPEDDTCRPLFIPTSSDWLAIVSGALTELTKSWNWEKFGTLTAEECVAASQRIVDSYYTEICADCELPTAGKIIRLNPNGEIEELVDGEWAEPTGDYELPPTPAREEATEAERLCAAAANASVTMQMFYENVSDSFNESLNAAAAAAALATLVSAQLGATGFGLALASLIEIGVIIFGVFYSIMEFIAADLWTEGFDDKFKCVLYECASEDGDVVHFDYACVLDKLANATSLTLDLSEVRLFGQIAYLLQFIGAQGLDAAGAATNVLDPDCDDCARDWCFKLDLTLTDGGAEGVTISGGTWTDGVGIVGVFLNTNNKSDTWGYWTFPEALDVYEIALLYTMPDAFGDNSRAGIWALKPIVNYREDYLALNFGVALPGDLAVSITEDLNLDGMGWDLNTGEAAETATLTGMVVRYHRSEPLWEQNCEP